MFTNFFYERRYELFQDWLKTYAGRFIYVDSHFCSELPQEQQIRIREFIRARFEDRELGYPADEKTGNNDGYGKFQRKLVNRLYNLNPIFLELWKMHNLEKELEEIFTGVDTVSDASGNTQGKNTGNTVYTNENDSVVDNVTNAETNISGNVTDSGTSKTNVSGNDATSSVSDSVINAETNAGNITDTENINDEHNVDSITNSETIGEQVGNSKSNVSENATGVTRNLNSDMPHSNSAPLTVGLDTPTNWKYASGQNDGSSKNSSDSESVTASNSNDKTDVLATNNTIYGLERGTSHSESTDNSTSETVGKTTDNGTFETERETIGETEKIQDSASKTVAENVGKTTGKTTGIGETNTLTQSELESISKAFHKGRLSDYPDLLTRYTEYLQTTQNALEWLCSELDDLFVQVY